MGSTRCMGRASSTTLMRGGLGAAAVLGAVLTTGSGGFTTGAMLAWSLMMLFGNPSGTPFGSPPGTPVTLPAPATAGSSSINCALGGIVDGAISVFDNGSAPPVHKFTRVLVLRLDQQHKRATLVRSYHHPKKLLSPFEGNAQFLPDGHVFVGWGGWPYVSELSKDGRVLFDAVATTGRVRRREDRSRRAHARAVLAVGAVRRPRERALSRDVRQRDDVRPRRAGQAVVGRGARDRALRSGPCGAADNPVNEGGSHHETGRRHAPRQTSGAELGAGADTIRRRGRKRRRGRSRPACS